MSLQSDSGGSYTKWPLTHPNCSKSKLYLRNITEEEKVEWERKLKNRKLGCTTEHERHLDDLCNHIFQVRQPHRNPPYCSLHRL